MRIGHGYDVHRLVPGRDLILGGVKLDYRLGLDGHSDADVLTHAVMDALLGAAGLGDIGRHFPDSDPAYLGIDSQKLLARVRDLLTSRGFRIGNIDVTLIVGSHPAVLPSGHYRHGGCLHGIQHPMAMRLATLCPLHHRPAILLCSQRHPALHAV